MAWSWLQSNSNVVGGSVTSLTVAYTSNLTTGTKLIALTGSDQQSGGNTVSVKDAAANSFTKITSIQNGGTTGNGESALWAIDTPAVDAGTAASITVTYTAVVDPGLLIQEVSGLATGSTVAAMIDGTAGTLGSSGTGAQGPPSYTSSASNEYLLYTVSNNGPSSAPTAPGSPYTADPKNDLGTTFSDVGIAYKNSTNGTEAGQWTIGATSGLWSLIMAAFKLGAAGAVVSQPVTRARVQLPPGPGPNPSRIILAPVAYQRQVILSGSGTLTVAAPGVGQVPGVIAAAQYYAKPPPSPPAQIVALAQPVTPAAATLSGTGTLTVAAPGVGGPIPAVVAAAQYYAKPQPSPASLIVPAAPTAAFAGAAALSGSGTLTAAPYFDATGTVLSGSGTLTAAAPGVGGPIPAVIAAAQYYAKPPAPPPAQIVAFTPAAFAGTAALSGSGTLTAAPAFTVTAALSGTGTLTASYTVGYIIIPVVIAAQPPPPRQPVPLFSRLIAAMAAGVTAALSGTGTLTASYTVAGPAFTVGTLTASDAPTGVLTAATASGGSGGVLTASDTRTGGPG